MTLLLSQATLIDGAGGRPLVGASVLTEGDIIKAVALPGEGLPQASPDTQTIDCRGKFVLPGLIDAHVHLSFSAGPDHATTVRQVTAESEQTLVLRELRNAQECLRAGITTVRDCGGRGLTTLAVRDAIASGLVRGPRMLASAMPVTTTFGHLYFCGLEVDGVEAVRVAVRTLAKHGVDFIKVMATGGIMTGNARPLLPQYSQTELDALCEEARRLAKPVAAHVGSAEGIRRCVAAGVNTIEHCGWANADGSPGYDPAVVERMASQGTIVDFTAAGITRNVLQPGQEANPAERERQLDAQYRGAQSMRDMAAAGVRIILSSDAGVRITPFGEFALSLQIYRMMMDASPIDTLCAVTSLPARALGLADRVGTVEVGKVADLVVLDADPLADLGAVRRPCLVIKDGQVVVSEGKLIP